MKGTKTNEKLFWDSRAPNYPLPFEPATAAKTRRILRLLGTLGVNFRGKSVLDIGCGTGVYALQLAARASRTLGIDSSAAMLKVFRRERRKLRIGNSSCRQAYWSAVPPAEVRKKFDIALASMTAAIKTRADLLKMEAAAGERCVYIGWAGRRRNALLEKVYAGHGLKYEAPEGAGRTLKFLKALGRKPGILYIKDSWTKSASPEETLREIAVSMKVNGAGLRREWTEELLKEHTRRGIVRQRTSMRKALITWVPPTAAKKKSR